MTSTAPLGVNETERFFKHVVDAITEFYRDTRPLHADGRVDVDGPMTIAALAAIVGATLLAAPANIRGRELKEFMREVRKHAGVDK